MGGDRGEHSGDRSLPSRSVTLQVNFYHFLKHCQSIGVFREPDMLQIRVEPIEG
jgi:hypothetical protein